MWDSDSFEMQSFEPGSWLSIKATAKRLYNVIRHVVLTVSKQVLVRRGRTSVLAETQTNTIF